MSSIGWEPLGCACESDPQGHAHPWWSALEHRSGKDSRSVGEMLQAFPNTARFKATQGSRSSEYGGALFAHLAFFILPRPMMAHKVTLRDMTRPGAATQGRARGGRLDLEDLTAAGTELRFFSAQARHDTINVGNFPGTQSKHVGRAGDALLFSAAVVLRQGRGPRQQQRCQRERVHRIRSQKENTRPRYRDLRADVAHKAPRPAQSNPPLVPRLHRFAAALEARWRTLASSYLLPTMFVGHDVPAGSEHRLITPAREGSQ
jgi:hypothetical protein